MIDLFEHIDQLPIEVQDILEEYNDADSYIACRELEEQLKPLGYTFDWGLSAEPFNLRLL